MTKAVAGRKHNVRCTIHVPELTKSGTSLSPEVYADKEKIGTMVLGCGSVTWSGGGRHKGTRISWSKFAQLMDGQCYGEGR